MKYRRDYDYIFTIRFKDMPNIKRDLERVAKNRGVSKNRLIVELVDNLIERELNMERDSIDKLIKFGKNVKRVYVLFIIGVLTVLIALLTPLLNSFIYHIQPFNIGSHEGYQIFLIFLLFTTIPLEMTTIYFLEYFNWDKKVIEGVSKTERKLLEPNSFEPKEVVDIIETEKGKIYKIGRKWNVDVNIVSENVDVIKLFGKYFLFVEAL